jgi:hypothetical protein
MVKNTTGGNKSKQQGRKFATGGGGGSGGVSGLRKVKDANEIYAAVSK